MSRLKIVGRKKKGGQAHFSSGFLLVKSLIHEPQEDIAMRMNMPGFTAEVSLSDVSVRYQARTEALSCGGNVQPASEMIVLNPPLVGAGLRRPTVFDPCYLRLRCQKIYDPRPELRGKVLFTHCWVERICPW